MVFGLTLGERLAELRVALDRGFYSLPCGNQSPSICADSFALSQPTSKQQFAAWHLSSQDDIGPGDTPRQHALSTALL